MKKYSLRFVVIFFACSLIAGASRAATVSGTVRNGTNNSVAAGVTVVLIALQGDMTTVANTTTDKQGHYEMNYTPSGQMPMLVRAVYKGVNFHGMLPPGQTSADIQIFEPDTNIKTVQFPARIIYFQPEGSTLLVGEQYEVQNQSTPPKAYFNPQGDFEFRIPDGAQLGDVSAQGPEKMPITQGTMDRGKNRYAIAYAFRPGLNFVRLSYQIPYGGDKASIHLSQELSSQRVMILAPPTVTVNAAGFQPAGTEEGMSVYSRDEVPAGSAIDIAVSGTAPAPAADAQGQSQQDPSAQGQAQQAPINGRDPGQPVMAIPPRLDTLKWVLLGGFGAMFVLGMAYLWRRPVAIVGAANGTVVAVAPSPKRVAAASLASAETAGPSSGALAGVDREIGTSLDQLKDTLFRLELRRQAGTISDAEYAEQRSAAEKILRDLVRG